MKLAIAFTNFGPYHLARLRALSDRLSEERGRLIAYEMAGAERLYPWTTGPSDDRFSWATLHPGRAVEDLSRGECASAILDALDRDRPDAVAIVGYSRPESMAALRWAERRRRPVILMSESQERDHPRLWWKEAVKRGRVRRCSAALVGGPRHRDYLVKLGMPEDQIVLGYNAVDHRAYAERADAFRRSSDGRNGLPSRDYFLAVSRFAPEKNLASLIRTFARYRSEIRDDRAWDLVLCGGGPGEAEVREEIARSGVSGAIHTPGFLQEGELSRRYAFASGFVHPSRMEPWGLVVNEAAACGLPLLVSESAGCVETLVPDPPGTTGVRFDPGDETGLSAALHWLAGRSEADRLAMGQRAAEVVSAWGPERFAEGTMEAIELAFSSPFAPRKIGLPRVLSRGEGRE